MQPVDPATFAAAMSALGPFEPAPHLAVAVSGGSDSLALLLLLRDWLAPWGGCLTALTVDHGLRPEAAQECRDLGDIITGLNAPSQRDIGELHDPTTSQAIGTSQPMPIDHVILTWQGNKPATGLMAAARQARYRLLTGWCRANDVLHLVLGHHADDQAETLLMRQDHGSGPQGLAGMAASRPLDGVRLLRPLLGQRKPALRAVVEAAGLRWIEDPSNQATRFERVRWRHQLATADDAKTDHIGPLLRTAAEAGQQRDRWERETAVWLATHGRIDPHGFLTLPAAPLALLDTAARARLLGPAMLMIGGGDFAPAPAALTRLADRIGQGSDFTVTLGGCLIVQRGDMLSLFREAGDCADPVEIKLGDLQPGHGVTWDRRFRVTFSRWIDRGSPALLRVAALGEKGLAQEQPFLGGTDRTGVTVAATLAHLPHPARASLPGLWQGEKLLAIGAVRRRLAGHAAGCHDGKDEFYKLDVSFFPSQAATSCGFDSCSLAGTHYVIETETGFLAKVQGSA